MRHGASRSRPSVNASAPLVREYGLGIQSGGVRTCHCSAFRPTWRGRGEHTFRESATTADASLEQRCFEHTISGENPCSATLLVEGLKPAWTRLVLAHDHSPVPDQFGTTACKLLSLRKTSDDRRAPLAFRSMRR
jgi:hypothetical protein